MKSKLLISFLTGSSLVVALCGLTPDKAVGAAAPAGVTPSQLTSLLPDEQDLQGFVRILPPSETPEGSDARAHDKPTDGINSRPLPDLVRLNRDLNEIGLNADPYTYARNERKGSGSIIERMMYSADAAWFIHMTLEVCESTSSAHREIMDYLPRSQIAFRPGTFTSPYQIGNESWCNSGVVFFRYGRVVVEIIRGMTFQAARANYPPVPNAALDAVANSILLRLAGQAELTGVPAHNAVILVNGKQLPSNNALLGSGKVYLPVKEFAEAAGWKSQWNSTTGVLELDTSKGQPILLTAGSNSATTTGAAPISLKSPVLKHANQPLMTLNDLLTLVKGRIVSEKDGTFKVVV